MLEMNLPFFWGGGDSVLHLGNVYFHRKQLRHGQEGVEMGSDAEVRWVSHLLQLRVDGIVGALTTKTTVPPKRPLGHSTVEGKPGSDTKTESKLWVVYD